MRLLRNLSRRKLRTGLTIAGITIGIWALVVFSSMAAKINSLVDGGAEFFAGKVVVTDTSGESGSTTPMAVTVADDLNAMDGVAVAYPRVVLTFDPDSGTQMSSDLILANAPVEGTGDDLELRYAQGRALTIDDEGSNVVVLGSNLADRLDKQAGDAITIHEREFTVVGVLEPTLTVPDTAAFMPLAIGQELFAEDIPSIIREQLGTSGIASQIVVYPTPGTDLDELAGRIEAAIPEVHAMTPSHFQEQVGSDIALFNAIIIGVALISLAVGGLSVINTMAMSVQERTREIGIKRAIGGSRGRVVRELVAEAGAIGLISGLLGLALGAMVVVVANAAGRASGTVLFDLTSDTALFAVTFSTVLGMVAGVVPAWSAARLDPVAALRHD
jgi:putative ABC transport system permease protein